MKTRSRPGEFRLFKSNTIFAFGLVTTLAISAIFIVFGQEYLYDNGKILFAVIFMGFVALAVMGYLRLQLRVAKLFNELRRTSEEQEFEKNRTLTLINSVKDAVILVDDSGYVALYNAATLDLFNTNVGISRKPVTEIFNPSVESGLDLKAVMAELRGSKEISFKNTRADGTIVGLSMTISRARSGYGRVGMRGFVFVVKEDVVPGSTQLVPGAELNNNTQEEHDLKNSWAVVEGSIENAGVMLERDNVDGAKEALATAINEASKLKPKLFK